MKVEIAERLVEALRSGEYVQGRNKLTGYDRGIKKFCCLGVLCDLAVNDNVISVWNGDYSDFWTNDHGGPSRYVYGISEKNISSGFIPQVQEMINWLGLNEDLDEFEGNIFIEIPHTFRGQEEIPLSELNDTFELTFDQIADLIEWQYVIPYKN